LQDLSEDELAEMPSCNLAESIHNKWKQQSGDRGSDLFVATVDDFVRAFMQCVAYYQFLKGERPGTGPSKEELKLRRAQRSAARTGNSKQLHEAFLKMPGANEWCTRTPHLEGEEVFVSLKRKPDTAFGSELESHRPDKISISRPRVQTRSSRNSNNSPPPVVVPDSPTATDEEELILPTHKPTQQLDRYHVTAVEETTCNPSEWHIARLQKTSAKACFAQQANTKKKCIARIVQDGKSTAAPTYTGLMDNYKKNRKESMQFFFCNDDIERCVKGTKRKWVVSRPAVPEVWPVKLGTNLSCKEILSLENAGFRLPQRKEMSPARLFQDQALSVDLSIYTIPAYPDEFPTRRSGKNIRRNKKAPSTKHANNCASALSFRGTVRKLCMLPAPALGCIVSLDSGTPPKVQQYYLTISQLPACTCPYFKEMSRNAIGKRGQWANCKHLYYLFTVICGLDSESDTFIHAASFSFNEVKRILESGLLKYLSS
jgi:hypothetical protein